MNISELKEYIKEQFGYPQVNVELTDAQMVTAITRAYQYHLKWAIGHSSQEVFFTKTLSAGVREYDLPAGVKTVINVKDYSSNLGGAQELFSVGNYIYQNYFANISGFSLVSYEISMQFLDLLEKYQTSKYAWKYHPFNNTILLSPTPTAVDLYTTQYMLINCFIEEGYTIDGTTQDSNWIEHLYDDPWFQDYCVALCKSILGMTRRKLASLTSLGNAALVLDGNELVSEGREEKLALEEQLRNETWEGMPISYD